MKISNKITESKKNLEETSVSSAISMGPVATDTEEDKLREVIRKSIKIYSRKKHSLRQENLQEQKLRNFIRILIKEQAEEQESAGNTTWKNVLGELLNYIIPLMREKYTQLQTNMTERAGFKDFVKTYFDSQFDQIDNADAIAKQKELEEQENIPKIDQIKLRVKEKNKDFIDVDDKSQNNKSTKKKEEPEKQKDAQSYEEIGQTFAQEFVDLIGDSVKDNYSKKIPAQDNSREEFKRVFFANIESWYEIWDENAPVSQADDVPVEPELGDLSSPEETSNEPEDVESDIDIGLDEDLFGMLEADLA
jgi:hypothetical protein